MIIISTHYFHVLLIWPCALLLCWSQPSVLWIKVGTIKDKFSVEQLLHLLLSVNLFACNSFRMEDGGWHLRIAKYLLIHEAPILSNLMLKWSPYFTDQFKIRTLRCTSKPQLLEPKYYTVVHDIYDQNG